MQIVNRRSLTQERLKQILTYDQNTGQFFRISGQASKHAGSVKKYSHTSYVLIHVDGHAYYAHRLAWLYMTGEMPPFVDHKDRDGSNNKWSNLRSCDATQNLGNKATYKNNQCGLKGIYLLPSKNKWRATVYFRHRKYHCGYFSTAQEAHGAYLRKAQELYGEFARAF